MTTTLSQPSLYVEKPFDKALEELDRKGQRIITLPENARLRIQEGPNSQVSQYGNYTKEGFIYRPKDKSLFVKRSPVLDNPSEATESHRNSEEFFPTEDQIERAKASGSYELPDKDFSIPTDRFSEDPFTVFALEDTAGEYGLFLKENGINEMPVRLVGGKDVTQQDKPFARQLWFHRLGSGSGLGGSGRYLDYDSRVRGVPKESGEAT